MSEHQTNLVSEHHTSGTMQQDGAQQQAGGTMQQGGCAQQQVGGTMQQGGCVQQQAGGTVMMMAGRKRMREDDTKEREAERLAKLEREKSPYDGLDNEWITKHELLKTIIQNTPKDKMEVVYQDLLDTKQVTPGTNVPWATMLIMSAAANHWDLLKTWHDIQWISNTMAVVWNNVLFHFVCRTGNLEFAKWWLSTFDILKHNQLAVYKQYSTGTLSESRPTTDMDDFAIFFPLDPGCGELRLIPGDWDSMGVSEDGLRPLPRNPSTFYPTFYECALAGHLEVAQWLLEMMNLPVEKKTAKLRYIFIYICHRPLPLTKQKRMLTWLATQFDAMTPVDGSPDGYESDELPACLVGFLKAEENRFYGLAKWILKTFPCIEKEPQKMCSHPLGQERRIKSLMMDIECVMRHQDNCTQCIRNDTCFLPVYFMVQSKTNLTTILGIEDALLDDDTTILSDSRDLYVKVREAKKAAVEQKRAEATPPANVFPSVIVKTTPDLFSHPQGDYSVRNHVKKYGLTSGMYWLAFELKSHRDAAMPQLMEWYPEMKFELIEI